jgi:type II secretory pathway component GspD/PulD (secretin)
MQLEVDVDQVGFERDAPVIGLSQAETAVLVADGQTLVLGGLFTDTTRDAADRLPALGDLPILGAFFARGAEARAETQLLVFITPTVVGETSGGGRPPSTPTHRSPQIDRPTPDPQLNAPHNQPQLLNTNPGQPRRPGY